MVGKMEFLAGLGVGYVLGTRAGRERYRQIKAKARDLWLDPRVQNTTAQAHEVVRERADHAAHAVKDVAAGVGSVVVSKVNETVGSHVSSPRTGPDPAAAERAQDTGTDSSR